MILYRNVSPSLDQASSLLNILIVEEVGKEALKCHNWIVSSFRMLYPHLERVIDIEEELTGELTPTYCVGSS